MSESEADENEDIFLPVFLAYVDSYRCLQVSYNVGPLRYNLCVCYVIRINIVLLNLMDQELD